MAADDAMLQPTPRGSTPVPDPTELTDKAISKANAAMRDYIDGQLEVRDERLRGIDKATEIRFHTITNLHLESKDWVANLKELHVEKFVAIQTQFKERDIRAEREARDNKVAVDAAFAAQKEAAARQDEANAKAIDKSEKATAETIKTNQELSKATTDALTKSLDEVKLQVAGILSQRVGATEQRAVQTESRTGMYAAVGVAIALGVLAVAVIGLAISLATSAGV